MGKNVIISTLPNISQNYLPKVNTSNIFANSLVYDDGSSVLINTTTASAFRLDVNGTGRFQGALTGTSATFSGSLIVGTGTTGTQYFANASAEISYSATTGLWRFNNLAGGSAPTTYYQFAADGTPILSILKSGAATFSSSVTAGGSVFAPNTNTDPTTGNATTNGTVYALNAASSNNSYGIGLSAIRSSAYDMWFQTGVINGGGYRWYIGTSEKMTMDKSGNVGIGTTDPQASLHIIKALGNNVISIGETGNNTRFTIGQEASYTGNYINSTNIDLKIQSYLAGGSGGNIIFQTGASGSGSLAPRMTITSGGNVLLGTTDNTAAYRLNVAVNGGSAYMGVTNQAGGSGDRYLRIGFGTGATVASIQGTRVNVADDVNLALQPDGGNVGIGTTDVSLPNGGGLVLYKSDYPRLQFRNSTSGTGSLDGAGFFLSGNNFYISNRESGDLVFEASANTERFRIQSNGVHLFGVNAPANTWTGLLFGTGTASQSYGLKIIAGSNTSDISFQVRDKDDSAIRFQIRGDGQVGTGLSAGSPYNNTSAQSANLVVFTDGTLGRSTSSIKYKTDVSDYNSGLSKVMQLRPVSYKGKNDGDKIFAGLIAEEVHELGLTEFVQYAEDGSPDALAYQNMVALLTKAIQELKAENDQQKADIESLKALINK